MAALLSSLVEAGGDWNPVTRSGVWHCEGSCSKPRFVEVRGALAHNPVERVWSKAHYEWLVHRVPESDLAKVEWTKLQRRNVGGTLLHCVPEVVGRIEMYVRCRKCDECMEAKTASWSMRAVTETQRASRTWFLTFTLRPWERMRLAIRARDSEVSMVTELSKDITKFLKRLRKNTKKKFRYLVSVEYHKDGFPHVHLLLHEQGAEITKREIEAEWPFGFSRVKLATEKNARYVCKYIAKALVHRVRASLRYGGDLAYVRVPPSKRSAIARVIAKRVPPPPPLSWHEMLNVIEVFEGDEIPF